MGTKDKDSKGKRVKVGKLKGKVEELSDKQAKRVKGGATKIKEPTKLEIPN